MLVAALFVALVLAHLVFQIVFDTADRVLHFADDLLCLTFALQLLIAGHFARGFLELAADVLPGPCHSVFVHTSLRRLMEVETDARKRGSAAHLQRNLTRGLQRSGTSRSATILMILMSGLIAGPAVSLYGSPTV